MTTVRHETVHYTAEEKAAKEVAEAAGKAKVRKRRFVILGVTAAVVIFGCLGCLLIGALAPTTPTAGDSRPIEVVGSTPFPTPTFLTVAAIEQAREPLTDMQKDQYDQSILGEPIKFHGRVIEVYDDGTVLIDESGSGFLTVVVLYGIPEDVAITWNKGHPVEGMGTVAVYTFISLRIEIQVTSWGG